MGEASPAEASASWLEVPYRICLHKLVYLTFENARGETFPHTPESWVETLDAARLYGYEPSKVLEAPRPGQRIPEDQAQSLADALQTAVREDFGEHSVMNDFVALLRGGGVIVGE